MIKIGLDIGGVVSKHPEVFREFYNKTKEIFDFHIITDMHDIDKINKLLELNEFFFPKEKIFSADYQKHGEMCKAILLKELQIDIFIDDFIGYVGWDNSLGKSPIRLLLMPDPFNAYWADSWKTTDELDFGRRKFFNESK